MVRKFTFVNNYKDLLFLKFVENVVMSLLSCFGAWFIGFFGKIQLINLKYNYEWVFGDFFQKFVSNQFNYQMCFELILHNIVNISFDFVMEEYNICKFFFEKLSRAEKYRLNAN